MTREDKERETERLKSEANTAKERLMRIASELYEIGNTREAARLDKIIERLEIWQNT